MTIDAAAIELLKRSGLLRGLSDREIAAVARCLAPEEYPAGAMISEESTPADRVCLLIEGSAEVLKRLSASELARVGSFGPGDFFGETSIILDKPERSASVRAVTPVRVWAVARADFLRLLDEHPRIMRNVLSSSIQQLRLMDAAFLDTLRQEREQLEEKVRARTREIEAITDRIQRELTLAQTIQRNLLPEKHTEFPGITMATEYIPCEELGGDIAGAFRIDESRIAVYGGDVCGHGIYAAMVMSYVKKLIETSVKRILLNRQYVVKPAGAVLTAINRSFIAEINQGDPEIYLTLFLGVLDAESLRFEYSSAGTHVPPLVISRGTVTELFDRSDFAIGHVPGHEFETRRTTFTRGDWLLFVSDGVTEASRAGALYGMDTLKSEVLRIVAERGGMDLGDLIASLRRHLGEEAPQDDMCLLALCMSGWSAPVEGSAGPAGPGDGSPDVR
jgi:phosphoserine phosphatase RsbU/P